jgi:hypothetical protein
MRLLFSVGQTCGKVCGCWCLRLTGRNQLWGSEEQMVKEIQIGDWLSASSTAFFSSLFFGPAEELIHGMDMCR